MAKFFTRLFSRGSSFNGSQSSLTTDNQNRSKTSTSSARTSGSLENLASYHVITKELEKSKLHKASWEGNLHKVERFARPGQINLKDQHMRTPLHLAVVKGHIEIVRYLVQENAKLGVLDNEQRTPLIKAVVSGTHNPQVNLEICKILINGGAGDFINAVDKDGRSALHYAINFDNPQLVQLFLSHENCDPNLQDRDQMTPLHLAIKRNSSQIVQLLLSDQHDQQADPNIANRYGQTPLHIAASVGYIDIVRLLLLSSNLNEPCDPTILDSQQLTAYELAKTNHQEACCKLIEEYQQNRFKTNLRRQTTTSFHEQLSTKATNSISMIPASNLQYNRDETSDESSASSISTTKQPSKSSPRRIKRSSDQWSDDNNTSINESKSGTHGIHSLIKMNPLQPNETKINTSSTLEHLLNNNPLQTTKSKKTKSTTSQPLKSTSFFGIAPVIERVDSENTSTSISIDKSVKPIQSSLQNKSTTVGIQPTSNGKSWSDDTITTSPKKQQEPRSNSWDTSVSDDDTTISKPKERSNNLQKIQPTSTAIISVTSSDTDDDDNSVETEIRRLDLPKPSIQTNSIENLVNKQIGNNYKVIGVSEVQSPVSDDSSWTTSPVPFDQKLPAKGVENLVQKNKTDDSTWDDDSRPLSVNISNKQTTTTGIENLVKIIDTIMHSNKTPKMIGKLFTSSMIDQTESISSDNDEQSWKKKSEEWSTNEKRDSFNDIQINELKENIKRLERHQEDAQELKRQLKDMETKKNNFEKLYRENDQMLRDIENKLEQERIQKKQLESTTEILNTELKNIKRKVQTLEDEKDLLNQRCIQLKQEQENYDDKLHALENNNLQSTNSFRGGGGGDDIDKIKARHREEMKLLSAENDDLHDRTKRLQSDLELHKESLDVTVRYKIDLEKAIEEKSFYQHELDRLKTEKNLIEQEKIEYKTKYNSLQDEIRLILFDRSKLEQKLTGELQEHLQEKQRSTDDLKKYRTQIEQLNIKLDDAEARLISLQTQNETLLTSKDREIKKEFESLTQRLNQIDSDKSYAEQRYHNHHKPLMIQTSTSLNNKTQHHILSSSLNPQSNIIEHNYEFNKTYPSHQNSLIENSRQIRFDTERIKSELDHLRQDFDRLISNYEPTNHIHQQTQIHSHIDTFRQFYEQEFRQRQLLMSKLKPPPPPPTNNHLLNRSSSCTTCTNNRLLKERLETAIDTNLADQRLQTISQLPRQASALLTINTTNNGVMSSVELLRKHYNV